MIEINCTIFTYNYSFLDNCMATIVQQSKSIISHPYFKHCLELAQNGDMSGFERLFYESLSHSWEVNSLNASRLYGQWHRNNHMVIKKEIREMPPPTNLDLRLPFIQPKQESRSQSVKMSHRRNKLKVHNGDQLLFTFILEKT